MSDVAFRSASALVDALRGGELSSRELLDHLLERVERLNPGINAVVTLDLDRARERADRADAARARGESWGPLHGLPITVKDCFETAGLRTTAGAPEYADHVPDRDAPAVERLREAGAIVFGKTNTPTLAMDWQTTNPLFGTTNNPWNPEHTPGGSSGGAAAAIAAGLSGLELGSDIGGSIRMPSHCCGVYGHKPSWGIVPLRGFIPPAPGTLAEDDINVAGPIARSASDLDLALEVLAGPLPDRARGWDVSLPAPRRAALADYRVAAWLEDPVCPVDSRVRERLEATLEALRKAGTRVDDRARPALELGEAFELFMRLLTPIIAHHMPGGPPGGPTPDADAAASMMALSGMSHVEWLRLHEAREGLRNAWADFFRSYDLMLCPVAPVPAIRHDHSQPQLARTVLVDGEPRPYTDHLIWTGSIGVAHLPATVAPVGRTPEGLPVGIQIVAPYLEDRSGIDFAARLADVIGGFQAPPLAAVPLG